MLAGLNYIIYSPVVTYPVSGTVLDPMARFRASVTDVVRRKVIILCNSTIHSHCGAEGNAYFTYET